MKKHERFISEVEQEMDTLDSQWRLRSKIEQNKRFCVVFENLRTTVDVDDSSYNSYKSIAKKAVVYQVAWAIAKQCAVPLLNEMQKIKDGVGHLDRRQRRVRQLYLDWVWDCHTQRDRMEFIFEAMQEYSWVRRDWTLPDVDDPQALEKYIELVSEYLDQPALRELFDSDTAEAELAREVMEHLRAYRRMDAAAR